MRSKTTRVWDDVGFFWSDRKSVTKEVEITTKFGTQTASTVNWAKGAGIWHRSWDVAPTIFETIQWSTESGVYLGVRLRHYRKSNERWLDETTGISDKAR